MNRRGVLSVVDKAYMFLTNAPTNRNSAPQYVRELSGAELDRLAKRFGYELTSKGAANKRVELLKRLYG